MGEMEERIVGGGDDDPIIVELLHGQMMLGSREEVGSRKCGFYFPVPTFIPPLPSPYP